MGLAHFKDAQEEKAEEVKALLRGGDSLPAALMMK